MRLRILYLLVEAEEICVCHIHEAMELPQPTMSRHLAYLRRNDLISGRKKGQWVYYRLAKPKTNLHRGIVVCLHTCLTDMEELRRDRQRRDAVVTSCDKS